MAPSPPSPLRLSFSSDSSVGTSDDEDSASVSSGSSESSAPTTPVTPVSPFTKTHRRASETDYFSQPERKVRFASLPFTPQLTVPYVEPLGQMSPLWRLDEVDESGHESEPEPTLKVTFKAMKEARKLGLPVHLPVVKPVETPKVSFLGMRLSIQSDIASATQYLNRCQSSPSSGCNAPP